MSSMTQALAPAPHDNSLRAQAYRGFTQQVFCGGIRAGQFISQRALMVLLEMPLGAVREMIPRLEAADLIRTVPQRGLQITPVNETLIRHTFQMRNMIEREAVPEFAQAASDTLLADLEASHQALLQRAQAPDAEYDNALQDDAQAVGRDLHECVVDAMGNALISEQYRVNNLRIQLIAREHGDGGLQRVVSALQEHLHLIAAFHQRNTAKAAQLLDTHLHSARDRMLHAAPVGSARTPPPPSPRRRRS